MVGSKTVTGNTVVTPGTSTDRHQNWYCTAQGVHQKKLANTLRAFSVTQQIQQISSSIPFLVFETVSCRNHTEIGPILSRGARIELAKLSIYADYGALDESLILYSYLLYSAPGEQ